MGHRHRHTKNSKHSSAEKYRITQALLSSNGHRSKLENGKSGTTAFPNLILFRSVLNDLPLVVKSLFVGMLMIGIAFSLRGSNGLLFGYNPFSLMSVLSLLALGVVCAVIAFRRYNVCYSISYDGVKALRGIITNEQIDAKLEYYQIRGTEIHRSLFERFIGTGDLHVRGSTSDDTEVLFKGIRNPYRYQKLIQERHRIEVQGTGRAGIDSAGDIAPPETRARDVH